MSPRRKLDPSDRDYFAAAPRRPLRWGLPVTAIVSALVVAAALAGSVFMLIGHERDRHTQVRDATALGCVRAFMTQYTTLDPFHANAYADRVLAQAPGDFAKQF